MKMKSNVLLRCHVLLVQIILILILHQSSHSGVARSQSRFWSICESQSSGIDDSITPDQADTHLNRNRNKITPKNSQKYPKTYLCWLMDPAPTVLDLADMRNHAKQSFCTTVQCFTLHIAEPNFQAWIEILSSDLQHWHVTTSIGLYPIQRFLGFIAKFWFSFHLLQDLSQLGLV